MSDNSLLERATEDSRLTLDVEVCLRADCAPNECQKPFSSHHKSAKCGKGRSSPCVHHARSIGLLASLSVTLGTVCR